MFYSLQLMLDLMNNPKIMVKRVVNDVCIFTLL